MTGTTMTRRVVLVGAGGSAAALAVTGGMMLAGGPEPRRTLRTSFGAVALLGSSRVALTPPSGSAHHHAATAGAHEASDTPVPSAVHGAWTNAVAVDVAVRNALARPMLLAPGQFRMRVDSDGSTVSLYSANRDTGPVGRGWTTIRITFLAPAPDRAVSLEFTDPGSPAPLLLGRVGRAFGFGAAS